MLIDENIKKIEYFLNIISSFINIEEFQKEIIALEKEQDDPEIWSDFNRSGVILQRIAFLKKSIKAFHHLNTQLLDIKEMHGLALADDDVEVLTLLNKSSEELLQKAKDLVMVSCFQDEEDAKDCFVEIRCGAGGTESQDWVSMLLRMYVRWCEKKNFNYTIVDKQDGEEAGIKVAMIKICGEHAFGWLKSESGIHRLVRLSPFNAAGKRHTSFASVNAFPIVDDKIDLDIQAADLRIDTYRSSGAGGQHVNTTDSAVRITHIATNIVVQCQNNRSQHKNKEECMSMLKAKLYEAERRKRLEKINQDHKNKGAIGWGGQIRSYVLHPYQMVKDLRTNYQENDPEKVLNGEIDEFIFKMLVNV